MGMISIAVEPRYRGGFMSVNSAIQQLSSGLANIVAGLIVSSDASGRLVGFPNTSYLSMLAFAGTVVVAWWLRSAVPHAAKPARNLPPEPQEASLSLSE